MREYTTEERIELEKNPLTLRVTKTRLYFTAEFKEKFWTRYQLGETSRQILEELGYNLDLFGQKQIDSIVQRIKKQAAQGPFREGEQGGRRTRPQVEASAATLCEMSPENMGRMWNELQ